MENVFQPPLDNCLDDSKRGENTCKKVAGTARKVKFQQGSGKNDGNYRHSSESLGVLQSARVEHKSDSPLTNAKIPDRIFFANLIKTNPNAERSQALDDWIRVWNNEDAETKNYVWNIRRNKGNGEFDKSQELHVVQNCEQLEYGGFASDGYDFADFTKLDVQNGDGLDDFFYFRKDGSVKLSLNRGGNPPKFEYTGQAPTLPYTKLCWL
ncbi:hypothetical protein LZL87_012845 [Fusarium oxysporum]|nr:hypothetical protein LZL87_012845 [Fusarium oxysporum]